MGSFHSGWWKQEFPRPFLTSRGCSAYFYLVVHSLLFVSSQMSRFILIQLQGDSSADLQRSLFLLSSTPACKFCISFFPFILYSVFSTQGYSCTVLVSPPCALFWKFSLGSQMWYLWGTLHLFPFSQEISVWCCFPIFERYCFIRFVGFSSYLRQEGKFDPS